MWMLLSCVQARIKGSLKVFFYDTEAGVTQVEQVFARPRALAKSPYMLEVRPCMRSIGLSESYSYAWYCAVTVIFMNANSALPLQRSLASYVLSTAFEFNSDVPAYLAT